MTPAAKVILGEADLPAHWGDLPGYGEAIADPKHLPPYTEDLGHGATHEVKIDGTEEWRLNGRYHRDGDLPAVTRPDGYKAWYKDGYRHRDGDLPAVDTPGGALYWYKDGLRHRDGGKPAIVRSNGAHQEWWVNGHRVKTVQAE